MLVFTAHNFGIAMWLVFLIASSGGEVRRLNVSAISVLARRHTQFRIVEINHQRSQQTPYRLGTIEDLSRPVVIVFEPLWQEEKIEVSTSVAENDNDCAS
jgi:hypothetical protein